MSTISASTTSTTAYKVTADTTGALVLQTGATPTTALTIDTSQNVGIGTSSPADKLDVARSSGADSSGGLTLTNTSSSGYGSAVSWKHALNGVAGVWGRINVEAATSTSSFMRFYTATGSALTEKMQIDGSGNLLVGTTSGTGERVAVIGASGFATSSFRVSSNGNPNINFRNDTGTVAGSITTGASTTAYNTSSDYRLKENIAPMAGALTTVAQLKPVTYTWKVDGTTGQGFIAHELQAVVPECVTGEKDAVDADGNPIYQGIDTSFLVATLTAAIQELKAELDAVKAQLQGAA